MTKIEALKALVEAKGGKSVANNLVGVLGELSATLGGSSEGSTEVDMINNITAIYSTKKVEAKPKNSKKVTEPTSEEE